MADFAEFIHFEANVKTQVKLDYLNYIRNLNSQAHQALKASTFGVDSAFKNDDVCKAIKLMLNADPLLESLVGVCPAFVEYAVIQPTLAAFNKSGKSCQTPLSDIDAKYSLSCFLDSVHENAMFLLNNPMFQCEYLVIPFLIREHFSISVLKLDKSTGKKIAHISYYDSYGYDLDMAYKEQLMTFFAHEGYELKYTCLSKYQQKDNHNCGIFTILKAIDLLYAHAGIEERYLNNLHTNKHDYNQLFNDYRYQLGLLLKENGTKIKIGACLQKNIEDYEKICF